jgi:hypothetical protein
VTIVFLCMVPTCFLARYSYNFAWDSRKVLGACSERSERLDCRRNLACGLVGDFLFRTMAFAILLQRRKTVFLGLWQFAFG